MFGLQFSLFKGPFWRRARRKNSGKNPSIPLTETYQSSHLTSNLVSERMSKSRV